MEAIQVEQGPIQSRDDHSPLSTLEWFLTLLILSIPVVNVIMLVLWALPDGNVNRRNLCRAVLWWILIGTFLGLPALLTW